MYNNYNIKIGGVNMNFKKIAFGIVSIILSFQLSSIPIMAEEINTNTNILLKEQLLMHTINQLKAGKTLINIDGYLLNFGSNQPVNVNGRILVAKKDFFEIINPYLTSRGLQLNTETLKTQLINGVEYFAVGDLRQLAGWKVYWHEGRNKITIVTFSDIELKNIQSTYEYFMKCFDNNVSCLDSLDDLMDYIESSYVMNNTQNEKLKEVLTLKPMIQTIINELSNKEVPEVTNQIRKTLITSFENMNDILDIIYQYANNEISINELILKSNEIVENKIYINGVEFGFYTTQMKLILNIQEK